MDAMIFAAGLGTRLRPLTDTIPKALIEVGGRPILEHVARRLVDAGARRLVINVHHHAGLIRRFVEEREGFGVEVVISDESAALLDTGGGLKQASAFLAKDAPFLLHNADVYTDIDLGRLYRAHLAEDALATLAVMERDASRYLVFDRENRLCGYGNRATGVERIVGSPAGECARLGFSGVHVISPRIFELMTEQGAFSIIELYMRLAGAGERIASHRVDDALWIDIGRPAQLEAARRAASGCPPVPDK